MAGRSGPTFQKRQKEKARQERQREKFEQRSVRKQEKAAGLHGENNEIDYHFNVYEGLEEVPAVAVEEQEAEAEGPPPAPGH